MVFIRISPEIITPSQDFLKPGTVAFIFDCIEKGKFDQLPPSPIVRRGKNDELIAVDGHNLIAVKLYRREDIEVHMANSVTDRLSSITDASISRNKDLEEKFEAVLDEQDYLRSQGITSFWDLINRYPDLFP